MTAAFWQIDIFAHAGPSKELVQAKFQRQRLEKNASKLSRQLDIFRPKSADYGSGVSSLGIGCDVLPTSLSEVTRTMPTPITTSSLESCGIHSRRSLLNPGLIL